MANLEDMLNEVTQETSNDRLEGGQNIETEKQQFSFQIPNFLKAPAISVPIEEYQNHTLNFDKKKSTGRIIRGLEGLLGALNYAIIDLIMGIVEKTKEKGGSNES